MTRQAEFRAGDRVFFARPWRPLVMGVLNAGPDSFSDPGPRDLHRIVEQGLRLYEDGADLIDVGGESGRTDRPPVPVEVEIERVEPVVRELARHGVPVSIDTWRAPVAKAALAAGAVMVNDMSALSDPEMLPLCARSNAALVLCHTTVPPKQELPYDGPREDVTAEVLGTLAAMRDRANEAGIANDRLLLDPGLDVGKTPYQSVRILRQLARLHELGCPVLLACSRKDFIGALCNRRPSERLGGTLAAVLRAVEAGVQVVRVHDVAQTLDFLRVWAAVVGGEPVDPDLRLEPHLRRESGPVVVA